MRVLAKWKSPNSSRGTLFSPPRTGQALWRGFTPSSQSRWTDPGSSGRSRRDQSPLHSGFGTRLEFAEHLHRGRLKEGAQGRLGRVGAVTRRMGIDSGQAPRFHGWNDPRGIAELSRGLSAAARHPRIAAWIGWRPAADLSAHQASPFVCFCPSMAAWTSKSGPSGWRGT